MSVGSVHGTDPLFYFYFYFIQIRYQTEEYFIHLLLSPISSRVGSNITTHCRPSCQGVKKDVNVSQLFRCVATLSVTFFLIHSLYACDILALPSSASSPLTF